MGIFRNSLAAPESLDLRRPRIPKAPGLPRIIGPRGGPAYRPDPRDLPPGDAVLPPARGPDGRRLSPANDVDAAGESGVVERNAELLKHAARVMPLTLGLGLISTFGQLLGWL